MKKQSTARHRAEPIREHKPVIPAIRAAGERTLVVGGTAVVATALTASALLAGMPAANAAPTATVMDKTQRQSGPNLTSTFLGWYNKGQSLSLVCYQRGQAVSGYFSKSFPGGLDNIWYKTSDGGFVADIDINTNSNNPVTPLCGTTTPPVTKPIVTKIPTITGATTPGAVLTANYAGWVPMPTTVTYQWRRDGVNITAATARTYTVSTADTGRNITVAVTGSAAGYVTTTAVSAAVVGTPAAPVAKGTGVVMDRTQRQQAPNLTSTQLGWYNTGQTLGLVCYSKGQGVSGYYSKYFPGGLDDLWYKTTDGGFVADVDMNTNSNNPVTPPCDTNPPVTTPPSGIKFKLPFPKGLSYQIMQGPAQHAAGLFPEYNKDAVDFDMKEGQQVVASAPGTVYFTGVGTTGEIQIRINHGNNVCSQYVHLKSSIVTKGQTISQGQLIGYSGKTGIVTGPHLHWNVVFCDTLLSREVPNSIELGTTYKPGTWAVSQNG